MLIPMQNLSTKIYPQLLLRNVNCEKMWPFCLDNRNITRTILIVGIMFTNDPEFKAIFFVQILCISYWYMYIVNRLFSCNIYSSFRLKCSRTPVWCHVIHSDDKCFVLFCFVFFPNSRFL